MTERQILVAVSAVSVVAALAVGEWILRSFTDELRFLDARTDSYWERRLHSANSGASADEGDTVYHPRLGWRMKPDFVSPLASHGSDGFRTTSAGDNVGRVVLAVGDSFTYGLGVSNNETYTSVLAQSMGLRVVNAGVNAYGLDQSLLMWELVADEVSPDVLLVGYFVDDFVRSSLTVRDAPKPYFTYDQGMGRYVLEGVPVPTVKTWIAGNAKNDRGALRVLDMTRWARMRATDKLGVSDESSFERMENLSDYLLLRLKTGTNSASVELIVLIIGHCYDGNAFYLRIEQSIEESCQRHGLQCINLARLMRDADYASFYGNNCHYSSAGHRFAASEIASMLESGMD